jgi:hypothetical protein
MPRIAFTDGAELEINTTRHPRWRHQLRIASGLAARAISAAGSIADRQRNASCPLSGVTLTLALPGLDFRFCLTSDADIAGHWSAIVVYEH